MYPEEQLTISCASTPGRLCLAGENLDWMIQGPSIVATIPLKTIVKAWKTPKSGKLALISGNPINKTISISPYVKIEKLEQNPLSYMYAAAKATLKQPELLKGIVIEATSNLPAGAGLASSASITLSVVGALLGLMNKMSVNIEEVYKRAYIAEVVDIGSGAGWMDFLACAHRGINSVTSIYPPKAILLRKSINASIILIDTRKRRSTVSVIKRKSEHFSHDKFSKIKYIKQMIRTVDSMNEALTKNTIDLTKIGFLLNDAHRSLRDHLQCSTELIELCLHRTIAAGAYGGKLNGSGHGGCIFVLIPPQAEAVILKSIGDLPVDTYIFQDIENPGFISYTEEAL